MRRFVLAPALAIVLVLPARAATIGGTVLGPDGKPIAGAKVMLQTYSRALKKPSPIVTTDAAGAWKIPLPPPRAVIKDDDMVGGLVLVHASGFALMLELVGRKPVTTTLHKGTTASGVVLDASGKPVANVPVKLVNVLNRSLADDGYDPREHFVMEAPLEADFTARTGADGRWNLTDLPIEGEATFELRQPQYALARAKAQLSVTPSEAAKISVKPAAIFTGRVVDEDGKPVVGAEVYAYASIAGGSSDNAKTGTDGTYRLGSLSTGVHEIKASDRDEKKEIDWVAAPISGGAVEGKEVKLPDIVATESAVISGVVTDADTGKPLPDVGVANAKGNNWGTSDAKGAYRLRVLPGKVAIYIGGRPRGYLYPQSGNPSSNIALTLKKGEVKTLHWKLAPAEQAQGVVLGPDKKPVSSVTLRLRPAGDQYWGNDGESMASDAQGIWKTFSGLKPGAYTLAGDDKWEVVSPIQITLPQKGALQVLVKPLASQSLQVRAVTPEGKPIPNVTLKFEILVPQGGGTSLGKSADGTTDAEGKFSLPKLRPDYRVSVQATREGHKYLRGGDPKYDNNTWAASDIVMMPLLGRVVGRVVDAAGQPVAGARIFSPDAAGSEATSDAQGRFALAALPEGEITLVATGVAGAVAKSARAGETEMTLALRPQKRITEPNRDAAYAILDEVWETSRGSKWRARATVAAEYAGDDLDQALKMALELGADKDTGASLGVHTLITRLLEDDPTRAIEWGPAQLGALQDPHKRLEATVQLGIATAKTKPDVAARLYNEAKSIKVEAGDEDYAASALAALAARLGNGEAEALADKALTANASQDAVASVANTLAMGSLSLAARAIEQPRTPAANIAADADKRDSAKAQAYFAAIKQGAANDPKGALALLDKIEKLSGNMSEVIFAWAALPVIKAVGPTDPAEALAIAKRVDERYKAEPLALAARFQPRDAALALLREASKTLPQGYWTASSTLGPIAAQAYDLDPAVGAELFANARERLRAQMEEQGSGWRQQEGAREVAILAFHFSRANPAESRVLLEEEWAFQKQLPAQARHWSRLDDLAVAMAALDPVRASEMAWQSGGGGDEGLNSQFAAQVRIARLLLNPKRDASRLFSER